MSTIFSKGDKVIITTRDGKILKAVYSHRCPNGKGYVKAEDGKSYEREMHNIKKVGDADTLFQVGGVNDEYTTNLRPTSQNQQQWDINKKFEFLSQLTRMVINKTAVSLVITGEGGLGKTYTVKKQLQNKNLIKGEDFEIIKGFSTARGLYRTLYENNGKLIIFDDCDEVLDDKVAKNLLKGALDSYDEREISWITKTENLELPDKFAFTGQIIFISNKPQDRIDQAILSRSLSIDLTMSSDDKLKRMEFIVDRSKEFMSEYPKEFKVDALEVIRENLNEIREFSLRSLEKVVKIRAGEEEDNQIDEYEEEVEKIDWRELAKFMLLS